VRADQSRGLQIVQIGQRRRKCPQLHGALRKLVQLRKGFAIDGASHDRCGALEGNDRYDVGLRDVRPEEPGLRPRSLPRHLNGIWQRAGSIAPPSGVIHDGIAYAKNVAPHAFTCLALHHVDTLASMKTSGTSRKARFRPGPTWQVSRNAFRCKQSWLCRVPVRQRQLCRDRRLQAELYRDVRAKRSLRERFPVLRGGWGCNARTNWQFTRQHRLSFQFRHSLSCVSGKFSREKCNATMLLG
jgi:hypothetical protein